MLVSFKVLMLSGNEFHNLGPDTLKERSAKIVCFVAGICKWCKRLAERRPWRLIGCSFMRSIK